MTSPLVETPEPAPHANRPAFESARNDAKAALRKRSLFHRSRSAGVAPVVESEPVVPGSAPEPRKRHRKAVPAHVRREVLIRDEQKCQARLHDGTICGSRVRLEFEHVVPDSLGGPTSIENGKILCHSHNQLAARNVLGEQIMELFGGRKR